MLTLAEGSGALREAIITAVSVAPLVALVYDGCAVGKANAAGTLWNITPTVKNQPPLVKNFDKARCQRFFDKDPTQPERPAAHAAEHVPKPHLEICDPGGIMDSLHEREHHGQLNRAVPPHH